MWNARALGAGLVLGMLALLISAARGREWTDSAGKHKTEAEFVSAENGVVTLKKPDGQTIHVPLAKLCQADQDYIKSQPAPNAGGSAAENPFAEDPAKAATEKPTRPKPAGGKGA